jgi:hypothetical protein
MVDERQRQMMTTDRNRQHYGPAGGPNRWTMDYPAEGMPTNYRGHSPHFRSGNLDVRYPGDFNAQQIHRRPPSNRQPLLNQPSYGEWMQQINPHREGQTYSPKQHPNPRMRGMMGGLGGLQEQAAVDPSDWRTIIKILEAGGDPGTETAGIGSTNEYQTAGLWQDWKRIFERTGNAELADFWISSQQAV